MNMSFDKYAHYEAAVQTTEEHIPFFKDLYRDATGRDPFSLREDFCGTFKFSCDWVRAHPKNTAIGVDISSEPINYGKKHHFVSLKPSERKRIKILRENVLSVVSKKVDIIQACNFSFFILKKREDLIKYCKTCIKSLKKDGILVLEVLGGTQVMEPYREQHKIRVAGLEPFTYFWRQKSFNPITNEIVCTISFRLSDGTWCPDVFIYEWRLWSIPEIREILEDAGYKRTKVYWEKVSRLHKATDEYRFVEEEKQWVSWISYVVGFPK